MSHHVKWCEYPGFLHSWEVSSGDYVKKGDILAKAGDPKSFVLRSPIEGTFLERLVKVHKPIEPL